ncbi:YbbR-like domain-containing protein [Desulfofalx alkaliphila]|uniref:CdaR family protein n=1 Tax=Desulfofalx alkaliphila TaxID=105483 RepID=UPI00068940E6|nr:CdaR family protein [Desulfofalx alkaliphila]
MKLFNFKSRAWQRYSLMLVSLMIAVILWVYVNNVQSPLQEQEFRVALEAVNLPEEMIAEGLPDRVSVRVNTINLRVAGLAPEDFRAVVDFSEATMGENMLPVQVTAPPGVQVAQVIPNTVAVTIDQMVQKQVPVQVFLQGNPQPGFSAGDPLIVPNAVLARGPGRLVNAIEQVPVTVNVEGANQNIDYSLPITIHQGQVRLSPEVVRVVVPINVSVPHKTVPIRVSTIGAPDEEYQVSSTAAEPAVVQVYASAEVLARISEVVTEPINLNGLKDNVKRTVNLQLPQNAVLLQPDKTEVKVELVQKPKSTTPEQPPEGDGEAEEQREQ